MNSATVQKPANVLKGFQSIAFIQNQVLNVYLKYNTTTVNFKFSILLGEARVQ